MCTAGAKESLRWVMETLSLGTIDDVIMTKDRAAHLYCFRYKPTKIQALKTRRVVALECNAIDYCEFALFLTSTGEVFSVGHGSFGRLGHGDRVSRSTPRIINALRVSVCLIHIHFVFSFSDCLL